MKELEHLKELYVDEIKKINKKGELTPQDSEAARKALEAIKMIDELCECEDEEGMMDGYSKRYPMMRSRMPEIDQYSRFDGDRSMSRGRDSLGRYTSRRNYSRHSTASHMIDMLEDMMMDAPDERKRMAIQNCINELEAY